MKNRPVKYIRWALLFVLLGTLGFGCKTSSSRLTEPTALYLSALAESGVALPEGGSVEAAAIQGVIDLFSDFSHDPVSYQVRKVYAESLFFRDGFKEFSERESLAEYMIESTMPLRACTFTFGETVRNGKDYFFSWTMRVSLKRDKPDRVDSVIGMSHIRFNPEGQVVFQQDYWDPTDVLYRRIPVAGWMINQVKDRL
jgi:hypothetical protein